MKNRESTDMKENIAESAKRVGEIVEKFKEVGDTNHYGAIRDLLTEILHWCDANDVDFDNRLKGAKEVYREEIGLASDLASLHCPGCGGTEFIASQSCRGTVDVIVTVSPKGTAFFQRNPGDDDRLDTNQLDFDDPEGPFTCVKCRREGLEVKDLK